MATSFMSAAHVGSYFVTQYYTMLQQQPELVHQLYSDASTALRIDGHICETASSMLQIHTQAMSMRLTSIEIKTINSLASWNGGVIVMVTGSLQNRDFSGRRKFAQTFFLAPQEKGFFVLNDIFHFIEGDQNHQIHPYATSLMAQNNLSAKLSSPSAMPEPVANYILSGGIQTRDYMSPDEIKENGVIDSYSVPDQRLQQAAEVESVLEDHSREQTNGFIECPIDPIQDVGQLSIEESVEEPQKHTYAYVLRAAKAQGAQVTPSVAHASPSNKRGTHASEWQHAPQQIIQQSASQPSQQQSSSAQAVNVSMPGDMSDDFSAVGDIGEIKSVYVRNLLPSVSSSELEEEFKKFGQLSSEGVAIRRLKDTDVCYAFVEFEDIASVQSAIKAGSVEIAGRQVYIEERRANSSFARGRRGRGRATYQPDTSRGRFSGRSYSRGAAAHVGERDFNRSRGNGLHDNMWDDGNSLGPKEVHSYLTRVMYNRRNKLNPLWNSLVLGGVKNGQKYLGTVNMIGVHYQDNHVATGFGNHLAVPILRDEWKEDLSFEDGVRLLEKCMRVLLYRDRSAVNKLQIAKITDAGVDISPPYSLNTYWDFGAFKNPTASAEGSW